MKKLIAVALMLLVAVPAFAFREPIRLSIGAGGPGALGGLFYGGPLMVGGVTITW